MKIVAASCTKLQDTHPQPVWRDIAAERPDALVLHGDNVYLDHDRHDDPLELGAELDGLYAAQLAEPSFAALLTDLRVRGKPVLAMYDDHDFLGNNRYGADHGNALRVAARAAFVRAFGPVMTGGDVYSFQRFGLVDVIVLDERFYRRNPDVSGHERNAILGGAQWAWFEACLAMPRAPYLVVVSTTTLHTFGDESWEQYPAAMQRMLGLLRGRNGALVLSGDVHRNATYDDSGVIEIVTSAVARRGLFFGTQRANYAVLTFGTTGLNVDLRSLKVSWRFNFDIPLANWVLP